MAREEKTVLGHIECPACPEKMRISPDKNGDPFGHCEYCCQQLRVGGKPHRIREFYKKYPWLKASTAPVTVTVTEPVAAPAPVAGKREETPPPPSPRRKASFADALTMLGVQNG